MSFHLERLKEASSWTSIGGFFLGISQLTTGPISIVALTLASIAFGAGYFIKEGSSGLEGFAKAVITAAQKPPVVAPITPAINAPSPVTSVVNSNS